MDQPKGRTSSCAMVRAHFVTDVALILNSSGERYE
jgi:hypothetical protein